MKTKPNKPIGKDNFREVWVCLIKTTEGIFILLDDSGDRIAGFRSEREGRLLFEDMYNRAHLNGHQRSMAACIHHIQFQPSIAKITDYKRLESLVDPARQRLSIRGEAGSMIVARTTKLATRAWEDGAKPSLITLDKLPYKDPTAHKRWAVRCALDD